MQSTEWLEITMPARRPATSRRQANLYLAVRIGLMARGTSLNRWCKAQNVTRQWAELVLTGRRSGPSAARLLARLAKASGVSA